MGAAIFILIVLAAALLLIARMEYDLRAVRRELEDR
jgi:hypothetical protein